jgi:hypothetical protein
VCRWYAFQWDSLRFKKALATVPPARRLLDPAMPYINTFSKASTNAGIHSMESSPGPRPDVAFRASAILVMMAADFVPVPRRVYNESDGVYHSSHFSSLSIGP